jgi:Flp pilus assembly protein TadD
MPTAAAARISVTGQLGHPGGFWTIPAPRDSDVVLYSAVYSMPEHSFSSSADRKRRAQLLERAAVALQGRQFTEAERFAAQVLKSSQADAAAASILGRALLAQNRGSEAVAPLEQAAQGRRDPAIETLLGAALGSAGRRAEAIDLLRRTTMARPPFLPAFQELAGQLAALGHLDEAIAAVESALAMIPGAIDLQLDLARLHLQHNERHKARAVLAAARDAAPERPDIWVMLARVLFQDGEYVSAADAFRHALGHRPDDVYIRADLAVCLLEMGNRDSGEASLRSAFRNGAQMLGRTTHALTGSSHGRFFFRPSAAVKFLQG